MSHLTDEQLSALADGVLEGPARAEAERHVEGCEQCRHALHVVLEQDHVLRETLDRDPGEAYFDSFAARVEGRIRAAGLAGAQERPAGTRGIADWFRSPRKLAWVGATAVVVVAAGVILISTREVGLPGLREPGTADRLADQAQGGSVPAAGEEKAAPAPRSEARAPSTAPSAAAAPSAEPGVSAQSVPGAGSDGGQPGSGTNRFARPPAGGEGRALAGSSPRYRSPRTSPAPSPVSPPTATGVTVKQSAGQPTGRAYEVRKSETGEDVPVRRPGEFVYNPPQPQAAPAQPGESVRVRKPRYAEPLGIAEKAPATQPEIALPVPSAPRPGAQPARDEDQTATGAPSATAPVPLNEAAPPPAGVKSGVSAVTGRICGAVFDHVGRALAGAQVTNLTTGATVRTEKNGSFCVPAGPGEQQLTIMAVGFEPARFPAFIGSENPQVVLQAVNVLGPARTSPGPGFLKPGARPGTAAPPQPARPSYDKLPVSTRLQALNAQKLTALAGRMNTAGGWDSAAAAWEQVLEGVAQGPLESETRWQAASARFNAWRVGPEAHRAAKARTALEVFLAKAAPGARRDHARGMLEQLK